MSTLPQVEPTEVTGEAAGLLAEVKKNMGAVPNLVKVMTNSPAVLKGWLALSGALSHPRSREWNSSHDQLWRRCPGLE